jgi:hypothetical protein
MAGDGLARHDRSAVTDMTSRATGGSTEPVVPVVLTPGDDPSMGPHPQSWPIPVADFLEGPFLETSDILLMRQRQSTFARLVRIFTGSFFSKASMVFFVPHRERDFGSTFVIEAAFSGVELTDLKSFLLAKEKTFVVAVKRYEAAWFEQDERSIVRGFMLSHIKAGYDFGRLFDNLWVALDRSGFVLLRVLLGPQWALRQLFKRRDPTKLTKFVGPGFIQWGYYETAVALKNEGLLQDRDVDQVIFRRELIEERDAGKIQTISVNDVLGVTAEDFARSPNLAWKYAIIDGMVYEITEGQQFYDLVKTSRMKWLDRMRKHGAANRRSRTAPEVG